MNAAASVSSGLDIRTFSAIELGMLEDLGYTNLVIPVPEPSTALLGVFASLTLCFRRFRKNDQA